ncbi:MAG: chorismate-binding protein [Actinomycetota bacterium]|nr:chorismate-binding protein [Actinomycetota bacterium]
MFNLTKQKFNNLSNSYNVIPLYRQYVVDTETPASLFLKIRERLEPVFLLESVEGPRGLARYSVIGIDYSRLITYKNNLLTMEDRNGNILEKTEGHPLKQLRNIMSGIRLYRDPGLGHFLGGAVGYIGYDMVKYFENVAIKENSLYPEMMLYLTDSLIVVDHYLNRLKIIATLNMGDGLDSNQAYSRSVEIIESLQDNIFRPSKAASSSSQWIREEADIEYECSQTQLDFEQSVEKAKGYIKRGDAFQIVLSQRFSMDIHAEGFNIYRRLRTTNPSPYMFFIDFKKFQMVGSSPEPLVKTSGDRILTCPIAGTRKRTGDDLLDEEVARELLRDKKEKAEHNMLVDLARNDLGRVSVYGSVEVSSYMQVEKYSHVMHLVSKVEGNLMPNRDIFDVLSSVFPAGTLTGAPKVRAMQIIEQLESQPRGP